MYSAPAEEMAGLKGHLYRKRTCSMKPCLIELLLENLHACGLQNLMRTGGVLLRLRASIVFKSRGHRQINRSPAHGFGPPGEMSTTLTVYGVGKRLSQKLRARLLSIIMHSK